MRVLIDGDACPNKKEIKQLCEQYGFKMIVFIDYAHQISDDYQCVICDIGKDSVDQAIVENVLPGDLVITQDYGLASLVLLKEAKVLHPTGKMINEDNISNLLMSRYLGHQERKRSHHIKGPKKRTQKDQDIFLRQVEKLLIYELFKEDV